MADSNPTLYASAFQDSRSPPSTFHPISLRLSLHRALTQDLTDYFHERSLIEDQYVKSLQRLSSRLQTNSTKDAVFNELNSFEIDELQMNLQLGSSVSQVKKDLIKEVEDLSKSHGNWNKKVESQVQGVLQKTLNGGTSDWNKWTLEEKRLAGEIKEYEQLVDKLSKAQSKSSTKTSKILPLQSSLSTLGSTLTSSLPSFLTFSQQVEQSHTQTLKQALTSFGTISTDLARERMELGEKLVVRVLGVEEGVEMQEWALREGAKASSGAGARGGLQSVDEFGQSGREREESGNTVSTGADSDSLPGAIASSTSRRDDQLYPTSNNSANNNNYQRERTSSRLSTAPPVAPLPLPTTATDDTRSINSSTTPSKSKSKLGSKLSSFLGGGKKDKAEKQNARDRSSSIPNSARYNSFSNNDAPPVPSSPSIRSSGGGNGSLAPPSMERNLSNRSNGSDLLGGGMDGTEGNGAYQAPLQPTPVGEKRKSSFSSLGGGGSSSSGGGGGLFRRQSRMNSIPDNDDVNPSSSTGYGTGAPFVAEPNSIQGGAGVDSEGYSLPPKGYDRAIGETTESRNLMDGDDDGDEEDRRPLGESVPKLNILPASTTSPSSLPASPILPQESEEERLAALSAIKNSLGAPPSSTSVAGGLNRRATARGRRSEAGAGSVPPLGAGNRSSMLPSASAAGLSAAAGAAAVGGAGLLERRETDDDVPLATIQQESISNNSRRKAPPPPVSSTSAASSPTSPSFPASSTPTPIASSINNPSRAMSILSTNSSVLGGGLPSSRRDPFEGVTEPGVRVSVVEQVNVLMKGGEVQKVLVTGEIGLSYRPSSTSSSEEDLVLRLTNHDQMEKTAPNSTYLTATGSSHNEFKLSKSALSGRNGQTVPILKYQLRPLTSSIKELVPLIVKPTWRCEPNLTRIIVVYSQNPSFNTYSSSSSPSDSPFGDDDDSTAIEYSDLKLEVPFNQGQITSFQSKPASIGTLSPSSGSLVFSLPTPATTGGEEKLLVSAQTEGNEAARVGNMVLSWRIEGKTIGKVGVELMGGDGVRETRRDCESGKYIIA